MEFLFITTADASRIGIPKKSITLIEECVENNNTCIIWFLSVRGEERSISVCRSIEWVEGLMSGVDSKYLDYIDWE
jgi:hypothetical protein